MSSTPMPQPEASEAVAAREQLTLVLHDAIDGDFLIDARGLGVPPLPIRRLTPARDDEDGDRG